MKKIVLCLLAIIICLSFTGCNKRDKKDNTQNQEYTIVDWSLSSEDFVCAQALEKFYEDDKYTYSFSCIKSSLVVVQYKDGTEVNVKEALKDNKIKIEDLDKYNISYYKDAK